MTSVLHTADTHLGYHQYHSDERAEDFQQAFHDTITYAIENNVDAVVHAGDLFHDSRPSIAALSCAFNELKRLNGAEIPFYLIVGNHEVTHDRQWVDVFETVGLATRLGVTGVKLDNVTLYGLDHVEKNQRSQLDYQFEQTDTEHIALVAHGLFTPTANGDWDTQDMLSRANIDIDVILAGDNHEPQQVDVEGFDCTLTYPGSTERTAADQRASRGFQIVEFQPEGITISRIPLSSRDFVYVDVEYADGEDLDVIRSALKSRTDEFADSVVVVTISGDPSTERIPVGQLEEIGYDHDALHVAVNDRRDIKDEDRDYRDVSFADPTDAVLDRRPELGLSAVGLELEEVARDIDGVPDSNLSEYAEDFVKEELSERHPDEFLQDEDGDSVDTSQANNQTDDESPIQDKGDDVLDESQPNETSGNENESGAVQQTLDFNK
jgi:exonuclease SbcD